MRQQLCRDSRIEGCRAIGDIQAPFPRRGDKFIAAAGLVLQQCPVTILCCIKRRDGVRHIYGVVRPGPEQDLVLAIDRHRHNGMAGGGAAGLDSADIHACRPHLVADPSILGMRGADMHHRAAGAGQRDRLVRSLAAKHALIIQRCQRFARCRKMRHAIDKVDIDGAEIENRHATAYGKLHLGQH